MSVPKFLFSSLLLVFLLGPNFKHLHAQETTSGAPVDLSQMTLKTETQSLSEPVVTENSTEASTEMSTQSAATTGHPTTTSETILTTAPQRVIVASTISDVFTTSSQVSSSTMNTHAITTILEKVKDPTTFPNEVKSTVLEEKPEETTLGLVPTTTLAPKTPVQSTTSTEMSESFTQPPVKTTPSRTTTTPTEIIYSTQPKTDSYEPEHDDLTTVQQKADATTVVIQSASETGLSAEQSPDESPNKWLIIIITTVIVVCIVLACCLLIFRHKKKNRQGHINGRNQRSKKKKGTEEDAWAGPVKLGAGEKAECDGVEEGPGQGDDKDGDVVLSTFAALEEGELNGGVGQEGSKEAKKWEEQEPLLYIDEEVKGEGQGQEKGEDTANDDGHKGKENSNGTLGQSEKNPVELNGAEAFCLTTAV